VASFTVHTFDDELYFIDRQRGSQRVPMFDHVGCFARGREIHGDRPTVADPCRPFDQPRPVTFTMAYRHFCWSKH
jgi:hypothetical protein